MLNSLLDGGISSKDFARRLWGDIYFNKEKLVKVVFLVNFHVSLSSGEHFLVNPLK